MHMRRRLITWIGREIPLPNDKVSHASRLRAPVTVLTAPIRICRDEVRRDDHRRTPSGGSAPGSAGPAFSARHSVADARGTDEPAHPPPLTLIAERGGPAGDSRARSRRYGALGSLGVALWGAPIAGHYVVIEGHPHPSSALKAAARRDHGVSESAGWAGGRPATCVTISVARSRRLTLRLFDARPRHGEQGDKVFVYPAEAVRVVAGEVEGSPAVAPQGRARRKGSSAGPFLGQGGEFRPSLFRVVQVPPVDLLAPGSIQAGPSYKRYWRRSSS
jgi:hypothetical protein